MPGFLNHDRLLELFEELNTKLREKGVRGKIYIVGGAAIALGFKRERTTRDVDARIVGEQGAVLDAVSEIAGEHDLPPNRLNEHARLFPGRAVRGSLAGKVLLGAASGPRWWGRRILETIREHLRRAVVEPRQ